MHFLLWPWRRTVSICLCCHPFFVFVVTEGLSPKLLLRAETVVVASEETVSWTCHLFEWVFVCPGGFKYVFSFDPGQKYKDYTYKYPMALEMNLGLRGSRGIQTVNKYQRPSSHELSDVYTVLRCSVMWDFFLSDHPSILPYGELTPLRFCFSRSRSASPHRSPTPADD